MIGNCLENVRKNVPLVHNITNVAFRTNRKNFSH